MVDTFLHHENICVLCLFKVNFLLIKPTGCPKIMHLLSSFEFWTFGEVFLGAKNNSKNFGN